MDSRIGKCFGDILEQFERKELSLDDAVVEIEELAKFIYEESCKKCGNAKCYCVCIDD